jgi:hypothetical protein
MGEVLSQAAGITVELDVDQLSERLGGQVSKQVTEGLAALFPREAGEFWAALCEQAYRERRRVASMVDLTCPHRDRCPYQPDALEEASPECQVGTGMRRTRAK